MISTILSVILTILFGFLFNYIILPVWSFGSSGFWFHIILIICFFGLYHFFIFYIMYSEWSGDEDKAVKLSLGGLGCCGIVFALWLFLNLAG